MAINLQTMNVLPPDVPSNRTKMAKNPSFGFRDDVEEIRYHKSMMDDIAGDKSNPLAKVAKVAAVLGEVAITAITTKVALSSAASAIKKSPKIINFGADVKTLISKIIKTIKSLKTSKSTVAGIKSMKKSIKGSRIGGWLFKKADAFVKNKYVAGFTGMSKNVYKSAVFHAKDNTANAIGALAGAGVLAKEITSCDGGNDYES